MLIFNVNDMRLEVLDTKVVNGQTWAICKGNLLEYLTGLRTDFFEFSVQRKIVKNIYLDKIYMSIEKGEPFPAITLTYQGKIDKDSRGEIEIDSNQIEILDGLQRTYRLWVVLFMGKLICDNSIMDLKTFVDAIKRTPEGEIVLQNRFITPKFIKELLKENRVTKLMESYSAFDVYFNIWTGLDDRSIIEKMLILNAGQKSVSSTHQYELLFLHFFEGNNLKYDKDTIKLIREKDRKFKKVQRGEREPGEFLMASVVVALQSFINGKPLRVSPANEISMDDRLLLDDEKLVDYFNEETLSKFVNSLYYLGVRLSQESKDYIKWYGKDTVLSGLFGAMGAYLTKQDGRAIVTDIDGLTEKFFEKANSFKLKEYYDAYDTKLRSTKVNVGNAVRKAIFNYAMDLLIKGKSDWYEHFCQSRMYDEE